jgi:hypothetical protein
LQRLEDGTKRASRGLRTRFRELQGLATTEERVVRLEAAVEQQGAAFGDLKNLIGALDQKMDKLAWKLDQKIDGLDQKLDQKIDKLEKKLDQRIDALDQKLDGLDHKIDRRFEGVEARLELRFNGLEGRLERRFEQIDKRFLWVIGIQFGIFLTIMTGMFGIVARLL